MKILIIQTRSFTQNESGVPRITYNLGRHFTEQGLTVAYFSFKKEGHIAPKYGKLYHVSEDGSTQSPINIAYLETALSEFKPDMVINQMPYEKELREALFTHAKTYNFKVIACIHNSLFTFKNNVKDRMKAMLPKPFNSLMATDTFSQLPLAYHKIKHRKDLIAILKANHTTLLYTPPNFEELKYFLSPKEYEQGTIDFMPNPVVGVCDKVAKKEKLILHVGSINVHQKRSDLLLDFWENTYKDLPDWKFQILGTGEYFVRLKADLEKRQLPRIELLGFQNPEAYYKKAAIFMMPSAYEGLPNTIIEANSFGCPILAFNSYAALEWIVDKDKNALLAKPYDTKEMGKRCIELAKDEKTLRQMQESALENAHRFSIEKVGQQWVTLFEKLGQQA